MDNADFFQVPPSLLRGGAPVPKAMAEELCLPFYCERLGWLRWGLFARHPDWQGCELVAVFWSRRRGGRAAAVLNDFVARFGEAALANLRWMGAGKQR